MKRVRSYFKEWGFILIFQILLTVMGSPFSVSADEVYISETQQFYTGYYTGFVYSTGNNLFEEAAGTLHVVNVENYELYYYKSTDGGTSWSKENIAPEHNGDVRTAALTVDHNGKVFIGFTCNDRYNYANPTAVTYGYEFYEDLYCINNKSGSWTKETIYKPVRSGFSDNYGPRAMGMVVDADNGVHLFANRAGWYTSGGTAWEWIRDAGTDIWGSRITAADPSGPTDRFIYDYYRPLIDSTGKITLILSRYNSTSGDNDYLFYAEKPEGGSWSAIIPVDQPNREYASTHHFDAAIDGSDHIYLVYLKDSSPDEPQILFSTDFGVAVSIYDGALGENITDIKLHSDAAGNLTLFVRRSGFHTAIAKRPSGGSWSSFEDLPTAAPDNDVFYGSVAHTDTRSSVFNSGKMTYFDREITGGPPYGPDLFYFNDLQLSAAENTPPNAPTATGPANEVAIVPGADVTLATSAFNDPGDTHVKSYWQIRRADKIAPFYEITSTTDLTQHTVSAAEFTSGLKYVWEVGHEDSAGNVTWSKDSVFKVGVSEADVLPEIAAGEEVADYRMISIVHWSDDPTAMVVLGISSYDTTNLRGGRYTPDRGSGEYAEIDDPEAVMLPGEAAWILARNGLDITVNGVPVSLTENIEVGLLYNNTNGNGWNQIAPPNEAGYYWDNVEIVVYNSDGSVADGPIAIGSLAADNPYIDTRLWSWFEGAYDPNTTLLEAYSGYWVKAKQAHVFLKFPHSAQLTAVSKHKVMFASLLRDTKRWMKKMGLTPRVAIADAGDSPPQPMGDLSSGAAGSIDSGGGGCFIATAAFGSPVQPYVMILKKFRDSFLLTHACGRTFTDLYYQYSPGIADFIEKHSWMRVVVRIGLVPVVGLSWVALNYGILTALGAMVFIMTVLIVVMAGLFRKGGYQ